MLSIIILYACILWLLAVDPPIPNATISVIDVTVIETPAWRNDKAMRSSTGKSCCFGVSRLYASTITNMSSTPIPESMFYFVYFSSLLFQLLLLLLSVNFELQDNLTIRREGQDHLRNCIYLQKRQERKYQAAEPLILASSVAWLFFAI